MNTKIDETHDFDFTDMTFHDQTKKDSDGEKLGKVIAIISPLLEKLSQDPEKTTLKWEKRAEVVTKMRARIAEILAS